MASQPDTQRHIWYTPAECAAMLDATKHGGAWRAACPAHGGENASSLSIREGKDKDGNPMTLMHCHGHQCSIEDICHALGIAVRNLFAIHPDYAKATRNAPRTNSPRINQLKTRQEPLTEDEMAQIMLEQWIVSDPGWLERCAPARAKMWELATHDPEARACFTKALSLAHINPTRFWSTLATEQQKAGSNA